MIWGEKHILVALVGALEHGCFLFFAISWECHDPNWLIFFRGLGQPPWHGPKMSELLDFWRIQRGN